MPASLRIRAFLKVLVVSALCGVFAGVSATLLLMGLHWATAFRSTHLYLIGLLPVAGFFVGWIFHHYGKSISGGSNLVLQEIHDPGKVLPFRMAPLVFLANVVSLLFGASVGREGTAVQMSASLGDQISKPLRLSPQNRRALLVASAGAGFGSALGAPWAGVLFGIEVIQVGRLRPVAILDCLIASTVGYFVAQKLGSPHSEFPLVKAPHFSAYLALSLLVFGPLCGVVARAFSKFTHVLEDLFKKSIAYPPLRPVVGGIILVALYSLESTYRFVGLGLDQIGFAFHRVGGLDVPSWKFLLTSLSLASGFKGGEFVPLVFIGSTLGSAMAAFLKLPVAFLTALGFSSVFAGASNTPLTCTIMAGELFGWKIAPFAWATCYLSFYFSGNRGLYHAQKKAAKKPELFKRAVLTLGEIPKRFFN